MWMRMLVNQVVRQTAEDKVKGWLLDSPVAQTAAQGNELSAEQLLCDAMFVFGSRPEAGGWIDLLDEVQHWRVDDVNLYHGLCDNRRILVLEAQAEADLAKRVDHLIGLSKPQLVVMGGFGIGLDPELQRGAIVVADRMQRGEDMPVISSLDLSASRNDPKRGVFYGSGISQAAFPKSLEARAKLRKDESILFCDPDGFELASVCDRNQVPWVVARILTEPADHKPSLQLETLLTQKTMAGKLGAAVSSIWNEPASAKELWKIQEDALKASDRLAKFLRYFLEPLR